MSTRERTMLPWLPAQKWKLARNTKRILVNNEPILEYIRISIPQASFYWFSDLTEITPQFIATKVPIDNGSANESPH